MSNDTAAKHDGHRVSKREFISLVAKRAGVSNKTAATVYHALIDELLEIVTRGDRLMLSGFGKFYLQEHKGHRVQFSPTGLEPQTIDDYAVLKFSATREINRKLEVSS